MGVFEMIFKIQVPNADGIPQSKLVSTARPADFYRLLNQAKYEGDVEEMPINGRADYILPLSSDRLVRDLIQGYKAYYAAMDDQVLRETYGTAEDRHA
jgi:hypothetical protein